MSGRRLTGLGLFFLGDCEEEQIELKFEFVHQLLVYLVYNLVDLNFVLLLFLLLFLVSLMDCVFDLLVTQSAH